MANQKRVSDDKIKSLYAKHRSIYRVAAACGLCPQSVHERLVRLGIQRNNRPFSEEERAAIRNLYTEGFERGAGKVQALADKLGRSISVIYTEAHNRGLCDASRPLHATRRQSLAIGTSRATKARQAAGTYKNAMAGRRCSPDRRAAMSRNSLSMWENRSAAAKARITEKVMKTRLARYGRVGNVERPGQTSWKAAWHTIGGQKIYCRSTWEANYAHYLEWRRSREEIRSWQHEPETFWFEKVRRGVRSYLPDFKVVFWDGRIEFHEVKGWMDSKSKTKIRRMKLYHPSVVLDVVDAKRYRALKKQLAGIVPNWIHQYR